MGRIPLTSGFSLIPEGDAMSGDDFAFYQDCGPSCYIRIGTGKGQALHQPGFKIDPSVLLPTAQYLTQLLLAAAEL